MIRPVWSAEVFTLDNKKYSPFMVKTTLTSIKIRPNINIFKFPDEINLW